MPGQLEQALVEAFNAMKEDLRKLLLEETPFTDGLLPITAGGTGEVTAGAALAALGGATASHVHSGTDITSGTVPAARLGSGASATTTLHGDQTFSLVDIITETTGTLSIARGGTGATSAGAALTALGGVAAGHAHAGTDITSGIVAAARLGSGASATTTLHGDATFSLVDIITETTGTLSIARGGTGQTSAAAALSALGGVGASHDHAAGDITSGVLAGAQGGTGVSNSGKALTLGGNVTFSQGGTLTMNGATLTVPATGTAALGTGGANEITYWTGANTVDSESNFTYSPSTNNVQLTSGGIGIGVGPSHQLTLSGDSAGKPSTNTWTVTSDLRTKHPGSIKVFTSGLAELKQLRPVHFTYNGNGGTPKGEHGVGLLAQEVQRVIPRWVRSHKGRLTKHDVKEIDILSINSGDMYLRVINALKEVDARLIAGGL